MFHIEVILTKCVLVRVDIQDAAAERHLADSSLLVSFASRLLGVGPKAAGSPTILSSLVLDFTSLHTDYSIIAEDYLK